MVLINNSY